MIQHKKIQGGAPKRLGRIAGTKVEVFMGIKKRKELSGGIDHRGGLLKRKSAALETGFPEVQS